MFVRGCSRYVTQKTRDYFKELDRQAKAGLAKDASSEAADAAAVSVFPLTRCMHTTFVAFRFLCGLAPASGHTMFFSLASLELVLIRYLVSVPLGIFSFS